MSWHPNDLVSDFDLVDYEAKILTSFGQTSWQARRTKVLEDWLFPVLQAQGFDPYAIRTRHAPGKVWGYTSAAYTDITSAAANDTTEDVNLATTLATPSTDAIYVGLAKPFRGLFFRLHDAVSSATGVLRVSYWNGTWEALGLNDKTIQAAGKSLSGGGSVTWVLPADWVTRKLNSAGPLYWVRVMVSAAPTGAVLSQLGCIRASALRAPATFKTLAAIMREAPTGQDGPWATKAEYYEREADLALQRALGVMGGEFDTTADDVLDATEATQTSAEVGEGWRLERA